MSATNSNIIVWGTATERTVEALTTSRRVEALRQRDEVEKLRKRYSEVTGLAARLIEQCRCLRSDNDDLRGSAEIWIRMYERQLERANALDRQVREGARD